MGIRETLEYYGITSIYHFTDKANLKMIEKFDIQSLKNIHMFNIPVEHFGADETSHIIDKNRGLDEYVHLSFIKDHPMYHVAKKRGSTRIADTASETGLWYVSSGAINFRRRDSSNWTTGAGKAIYGADLSFTYA